MPEVGSTYIIDDEEAVRESMLILLEALAMPVRCFESAEEFLAAANLLEPGCVLSDLRMPGMGGIELLQELRERKLNFPVIVMTGYGDVPLAVRALKAGAADFIEKPFPASVVIDAVLAALESGDSPTAAAEAERVFAQFQCLTARERDVMDGLVGGKQNNEIAECLGIEPGAVEVHRAHIMEKMNARSLSSLVRMAITAGLKVL